MVVETGCAEGAQDQEATAEGLRRHRIAIVSVAARADSDRYGVPLSRPRRRGSTRGCVPCTVPGHLCEVLGLRCVLRSRTSAPALGVPGGESDYPPTLGFVHASTPATCSPFRAVSPAAQPPSWSAESACRSRAAAGQGHRLGCAAQPPTGRRSSSVRSVAGAMLAAPRRLRR